MHKNKFALINHDFSVCITMITSYLVTDNSKIKKIKLIQKTTKITYLKQIVWR